MVNTAHRRPVLLQQYLHDVLLALGLLFTTASQLRFPGIPLGPGELALALWITFAVAAILLRPAAPAAVGTGLMVLFWAVFATALCIGTITAIVTAEPFESDLMLHDAAAYMLAALVSCLCLMLHDTLQRVSWIVLIGAAASLGLQLLNANGLFQLPGVDPWYWERLRGWSDNPNQLSILCLVVVVLACHLAETAGTARARCASLILLAPALVAGRMSRSDTFTVALSAATMTWIAVKLLAWAVDPHSRCKPRTHAAHIALLAVPALLLGTAPLLANRAEDVGAFALGFAKNGGVEVADEANLRMQLWQEALDRGLHAASLGLGPGPHLQIPSILVASHLEDAQPTNGSNPIQNGTANFEAHNSVLDLFAQGGLIAVMALLGLLLYAGFNVWRARTAALAALLVAVALFMLTNNIVRQPVFWFALCLCVAASRGAAERPAAAGTTSCGATQMSL